MCDCKQYKAPCTEKYNEWMMDEGHKSVKNLLKTIAHINEQCDSNNPYFSHSQVECLCNCWKTIGEIVDIHKDHVKIKLMGMEMGGSKESAHASPTIRTV